jgi:hypothetical protein
MTNNKQFTDAIEAWAAKVQRQMETVARDSIRDVIADAQRPVTQGGNMPVLKGNLRNSLTVEMRIGRVSGANAHDVALSGYQLGDNVLAGWTSNYALARHYQVGTQGGGGMWRDAAAQKWTRIVQSNARKQKP